MSIDLSRIEATSWPRRGELIVSTLLKQPPSELESFASSLSSIRDQTTKRIGIACLNLFKLPSYQAYPVLYDLRLMLPTLKDEEIFCIFGRNIITLPLVVSKTQKIPLEKPILVDSLLIGIVPKGDYSSLVAIDLKKQRGQLKWDLFLKSTNITLEHTSLGLAIGAIGDNKISFFNISDGQERFRRIELFVPYLASHITSDLAPKKWST